jgi:hypothetical protein
VRSHFRVPVAGHRAGRAGAHLGDIGHAIQKHAEKSGYSVVREFCGHGIGARFHEEPQVLHYGRPHTGIRLEAGMIFTIEPMINAGKAAIRTMADGWTIVTKDHSLSAQWEHTILVTETGYEVLTVSQGTPRRPDWIGPKPHGHRHRRSPGAGRALPVTPAVRPGDDPRALSRRRRRAAPVARALPPGRRSPLRPVARWSCRRRWHWSPSVATGAANSIRPPTSISCSFCRSRPTTS